MGDWPHHHSHACDRPIWLIVIRATSFLISYESQGSSPTGKNAVVQSTSWSSIVEEQHINSCNTHSTSPITEQDGLKRCLQCPRTILHRGSVASHTGGCDPTCTSTVAFVYNELVCGFSRRENDSHCCLQRLLPPTLEVSWPKERSSHPITIHTSFDQRALGGMDFITS